ncbi:F-actin-capping protein subunit alpha [Histomonas meleagridis]|uniref:F-actin-capping protein subunit alpha n=1 Tax=Histomonas meleagridis TaxID=135588 RepID=UPI00355AB07B|nr:F-actin-capping protein subunit alpha [Histomonas meleagridis]KAH0797992.1 F-actin-capping protein subunit alpha [Histomonas meleagridis]
MEENKENATDVIASILYNSLPEEYEQCYSLLSEIVDKTLLLEARAKTILKWNLRQCTYVPFQNYGAILCPEALQKDGTFYDPIACKTFQYDFSTCSAVGERRDPETEPSELRDCLQNIFIGYVRRSYHENSAIGVYDLPKQTIAIVIRSSFIDTSEYQSGSVISHYLYCDNILSGRIESIQHFFEGLNTLCQNRSKLHPTYIEEDDDQKTAKKILDEIVRFEERWLDSISEAFSKASEGGLNKLRFQNPSKRSSINWKKEFTKNDNER